jgi:hypothetical protein
MRSEILFFERFLKSLKLILFSWRSPPVLLTAGTPRVLIIVC